MTTATGHVHHTPPVTVTPIDRAWRHWSHAWTALMPVLTGRTDLTVTVAPGAGHGHPACYIPSLATIEINAAIIGNPGIANPRRPGHKKTVPAAFGALVHEGAHAVHTRWKVSDTTAPIVGFVAKMLEESRIEHQHRLRRRRDRQWLRHCATTIVGIDDAPTDTAFNAAHTAVLILARVDARILTTADARPVRTAVTRILGRRTLAQLRTIWRSAHTVADDDADTMLTLAADWCHTLGIDPDTHPERPDPHTGTGTTLAAAITAVAQLIAPPPLLPPPPQQPRGGGSDDTLPDGTNLDRFEEMPATWDLRPATPAERLAARHLGTVLEAARGREPVRIRESSLTPPGRLRIRPAITAAAQRQAGTVPTAQPWQRTRRRPAPTPDLTLAVLVDVSGSMKAFAAPMSSAAWILARAATTASALTATIAFGERVTIVTRPGHRTDQVREFHAHDGTERFGEAIAVADRLLHLRTPGRIRLVVIVSDGLFRVNGLDHAQNTITRLIAAGCAVLCLTPDTRIHTYTGPTTITVATPADCAALIGRAATQALTHR
jgi:VWA domain containing CoxE-like protein